MLISTAYEGRCSFGDFEDDSAKAICESLLVVILVGLTVVHQTALFNN